MAAVFFVGALTLIVWELTAGLPRCVKELLGAEPEPEGKPEPDREL